jgi:hypothetical protein
LLLFQNAGIFEDIADVLLLRLNDHCLGSSLAYSSKAEEGSLAYPS